jgi:hypothetical protein
MAPDTILGVTARDIDELPTAMGSAVRLARAGLGLSGFGEPGKAYEAPAWTEGR